MSQDIENVFTQCLNGFARFVRKKKYRPYFFQVPRYLIFFSAQSKFIRIFFLLLELVR